MDRRNPRRKSSDTKPAKSQKEQKARTKSQALKRVAIGITVLATACIAAVGYLTIVFPDQRGKGNGRVVSIDMLPNITVKEVAEQLTRMQILDDPELFIMYIRLIGADKNFRTGRILINDTMSIRQVTQRLAAGFGFAQVRVTIPEGYNRFDIARRFQDWGLCNSEAFIKATKDQQLLAQLGITAPTAEGYLFPDTYRLHDGIGEARLIQRLVRNFQRRVKGLLQKYQSNLNRMNRELKWNFHQVLIMASIIEKEAAIYSEQRMVAGVLINRLSRPEFPLQRLQADPTVSYGCLEAPQEAPSCAHFDGKRITRSMTQDSKNAYNTYRIEGLPPGPISNPGLQAIRATLDPATHDFFYFVVNRNGHHRFSKTLEEHNFAVEEYRTRQLH